MSGTMRAANEPMSRNNGETWVTLAKLRKPKRRACGMGPTTSTDSGATKARIELVAKI